MKKKMITSLFLSFGMAVSFMACTDASGDNVAAKTNSASLVQRGAYLVSTIGCEDCHSPKQFGPQGPEPIPGRRFSGYPEDRPVPAFDTSSLKKGWVNFNGDLTLAVGPWGASFAANISSDSTGIGAWKEEQFFRALREGKWKGLANARPLMPPMPWQNFSKLSDEDIRAIFYYLKSTQPVKNLVPDYQPLKKS